MFVMCNGPRKAGTYMLRRCVECLGIEPLEGIFRPDGFDLKNGSPKLPLHSFCHGVKSSQYDLCAVSHFPYADRLDFPTITILRDPRNITVSFMRWALQRTDTKVGSILSALPNDEARLIAVLRNMNKQSLGKELCRYSPWLYDPKSLIVRFEDLTDNVKQSTWIIAIADYLRISGVDVQAIIQVLNAGDTRTYNKVRSDWQQYFTARVFDVFEECGGFRVMQEWGYH